MIKIYDVVFFHSEEDLQHSKSSVDSIDGLLLHQVDTQEDHVIQRREVRFTIRSYNHGGIVLADDSFGPEHILRGSQG